MVEMTSLKAKLERMGWQDISSAPKDKPIQVINGVEGGYHTEPYDVGVAEWTERDGLGNPNWSSIACCDGVSYYIPVGWKPLDTPQSDKEKLLAEMLLMAVGVIEFYADEANWKAPMGLPKARSDAGSLAQQTLASIHEKAEVL